MHDAGNLQVGERPVERFVMNAAQETHHVVLRVFALCCDVVVDVVLEAVEARHHVRGLLGCDLMSQPVAVDEWNDRGIAPFGEERDIGEREPQDAGHDMLRERSCELRDEFDLVVIDPGVEKGIRVSGDHLTMSERPGPNPWVGEFATMPVVQLLGGTQRQHRCLHQVVMGGVGLLGAESFVAQSTEPIRCEAGEALWIANHQFDVGMFSEHEGICAWC